jgi:tetratricopeptide (TPR) repeat protein
MINKENILFCIVGLLGGLIVGFMFANSVNQGQIGAQTTNAAAASMPGTGGMPPGGHPPMGDSADGSMEDIQTAIEKAKGEPNNFDAQIKAAELFYQIQRFDGAVEYLKKASELKPDDYVTVVNLGNAYFDSNKFEDAEKTYAAALAKKPEDLDVRTDMGLTFVMREKPDFDRAIKEFSSVLEKDPNHSMALQNLAVAYTKKGDAKKANETVARLETADPKNASVAKLKEEIAKIGSN